MEFTEENVVRVFTKHIQPKVRVDGGDVAFEKLAGDTVHLGAHADCASCPAAGECLRWWCEQVFGKAFARPCPVVIHKHLPYFKG